MDSEEYLTRHQLAVAVVEGQRLARVVRQLGELFEELAAELPDEKLAKARNTAAAVVQVADAAEALFTGLGDGGDRPLVDGSGVPGVGGLGRSEVGD